MDEDRAGKLNANKRDRKVEITEIAISKVPLVQYREIPKEHYEILREIAKEVLRISKEKNDCNEVAITNRGAISYLVKTEKYNRTMAMQIMREAVIRNEKAKNLKQRQEASEYFMNNCYKAGLIYEIP